MAWGTRWRIDAGHATDTGPRRADRTGAAFRVSGTTASTRAASKQRRDGDRHGAAGHLGLRGEVALTHLLTPAVGIDLDHLDRQGIVEVRHPRVVEGEVAVLADSQTAEVEGVGRQEAGVAPALGSRVGEPVEVVRRPAGGRGR